jgi:hypothetical protein
VDFSRLNNPSVAGLTQRLEDGYRRIDEAQRNGADTSVWEEFWLKLLHEYEMLCDELDHAA